jgi:transposase
MNYLYFIGIDVSKKTLDIAVYRNNNFLFHIQISNDPEGLKDLFKQLKQLPGFSVRQTVFCMEHTGIYNQHVLRYLYQKGANICLESPARIKNSLGLQRGKNDKVDSKRIAQYAYKNREELRLWKPQREVVQQLSHLAAARTRLINVKNQLTVPCAEVLSFDKRAGNQIQQHCNHSVRALERDIKNIEKAIEQIIATDRELKRLFAIVTSVDGVGKVTAVQMIVTTGEFKMITEPAQFACHAGVVPYEYTSGTTIRGKDRVSHKANKTLKTLLHMCAISAIGSDSDLKLYYQRKLEEKKHKMSVINAVRNKLVWRVFACVRDNRLYEKKYESALV